MSVSVHRMCAFDYLATTPDASVSLIVTDPPYGGILRAKWDKWDIVMQRRLASEIYRVLTPGGTAYVWGGIGTPKNRIFFEWLSTVETDTHLTVWDVITWSKRRAYGTSHRLLFTREECAMLVKGAKPKTFHVPLLEEKRGYAGFNLAYPAKSEYKRRTNVWSDVPELFRGKIHPAEKPPRLAEIMIQMSSDVGDTVLDLFAGSGSTGVAALATGRDAILIEKSDCPMHTFTPAGG